MRPVNAPPEHFGGLPGNSLNPKRPLYRSLLRGLICRCPACGEGRLFPRFLKVTPWCESCGEALYHARTDDAPPYFVMLITGHILVPVALVLEETIAPPVVVTTSILVTLACVLCLGLLQPVKGVLVGLQWALWMHGFDPNEEEDPTRAPPEGALAPARVAARR
jgi:uncharacterized protein (DUF983 family)